LCHKNKLLIKLDNLFKNKKCTIFSSKNASISEPKMASSTAQTSSHQPAMRGKTEDSGAGRKVLRQSMLKKHFQPGDCAMAINARSAGRRRGRSSWG
jgi:hypothetical protein